MLCLLIAGLRRVAAKLLIPSSSSSSSFCRGLENSSTGAASGLASNKALLAGRSSSRSLGESNLLGKVPFVETVRLKPLVEHFASRTG